MKILLALIVVAIHSMPAWMIAFTNPLWSLKSRKSILIALAALATAYYVLLLVMLKPKLFSNALTMSISIAALAINWMITVYRAYQLWPHEIH